MDVSDQVALALFVVGGLLVALMVVVTQRSYKKDERSEYWVVYPTAKGEKAVAPRPPEALEED
ncbi:hypothetical protein [Glycomyces albidus]|uniref:Uncharacterized protein n=1 Tax=Glycomyces albidus TaxID=2656774 RepID=A0A6L5GCI5_9ACTN|nr:hypothetical protein [Glycomyces albidus]MQM27301.1 hypothetical protein [Glycomyces albidus]